MNHRMRQFTGGSKVIPFDSKHYEVQRSTDSHNPSVVSEHEFTF